jgi:hypothetical protein
MLQQVSDVMNEYDVDDVVFKRTDKEGLQAVDLDLFTSKLIRNNPVQAARQMSPAPIVVHVRSKVQVGDELHIDAVVQKPASVESIKVTLTAGHDTLAEAFGDHVYIRMKGDRVESLFDGRWKSCAKASSPDLPNSLFVQDDGHITVCPVKVTDCWATVDVKTLLWIGEQRGTEHYYLPRVWNTDGPWISHADLKLRYEEYQKEKEATCLKDEPKA